MQYIYTRHLTNSNKRKSKPHLNNTNLTKCKNKTCPAFTVFVATTICEHYKRMRHHQLKQRNYKSISTLTIATSIIGQNQSDMHRNPSMVYTKKKPHHSTD